MLGRETGRCFGDVGVGVGDCGDGRWGTGGGHWEGGGERKGHSRHKINRNNKDIFKINNRQSIVAVGVCSGKGCEEKYL